MFNRVHFFSYRVLQVILWPFSRNIFPSFPLLPFLSGFFECARIFYMESLWCKPRLAFLKRLQWTTFNGPVSLGHKHGMHDLQHSVLFKHQLSLSFPRVPARKPLSNSFKSGTHNKSVVLSPVLGTHVGWMKTFWQRGAPGPGLRMTVISQGWVTENQTDLFITSILLDELMYYMKPMNMKHSTGFLNRKGLLIKKK